MRARLPRQSALLLPINGAPDYVPAGTEPRSYCHFIYYRSRIRPADVFVQA